MDNSSNTCLLSENLKNIINNIASESKFKSYKVNVDKGEFTGDNYLGEIIRIKVISTGEENLNETIHLIVKIALESKETRKILPITTFYINEIAAYSNIIPEIQKFQESNGFQIEDVFNTPRMFYASKETGKEMVVLEDMSYKGYKMFQRLQSFDFQHVELIVKNLARYHATSFVMREKDPKLFAKLVDQIPKETNYPLSVATMVESCHAIVSPRIDDPVNKKKCEETCIDVDKKLTELLNSATSEPYNVICHGDCWINNFLFKYQGNAVTEVSFIDWQLTRYASPVTDLAYMFLASSDTSLLEKHFNTFLEIYYNTLCKSIKVMGAQPEKCYPQRVFQDHVKNYIKFGFLMSFCVVPLILVEAGEEQELSKSMTEVKVNKKTFERLTGHLDFCVKNNFI